MPLVPELPNHILFKGREARDGRAILMSALTLQNAVPDNEGTAESIEKSLEAGPVQGGPTEVEFPDGGLRAWLTVLGS